MRFAASWHEATIRRIVDLTPTARSFEIVPVSGIILPFSVGSHVDVTVYVDGLPQTRSYSLIGEAGAAHYRIAVKRRPDSRGGSDYMWSLAEGSRLSITEPKTSFELDLGHPEYLLIAGGIGITPMAGMAALLARRGAPARLAYAVRHRDELALADEIEACLGSRFETYISGEGQRLDLEAQFSRLSADAFCAICGPMPMLEEARLLWSRSGRPAANLRWETFGSSGRLASEAFRVVLPRHGREIIVPRNKSLLDALDDAGIDVIYDCRKGECGLCAMSILSVSGEVDHRDVFFSDQQKQENHKLCACVSRVVGTVVLDSDYRPDRGTA